MINQSPLLLKFHKRWGIAQTTCNGSRRNKYVFPERLGRWWRWAHHRRDFRCDCRRARHGSRDRWNCRNERWIYRREEFEKLRKPSTQRPGLIWMRPKDRPRPIWFLAAIAATLPIVPVVLPILDPAALVRYLDKTHLSALCSASFLHGRSRVAVEHSRS